MLWGEMTVNGVGEIVEIRNCLNAEQVHGHAATICPELVQHSDIFNPKIYSFSQLNSLSHITVHSQLLP